MIKLFVLSENLYPWKCMHALGQGGKGLFGVSFLQEGKN
jgi:hypothetical protein